MVKGNITTDSLTMFGVAAKKFFHEEIKMKVPDEVIQYILIYRFDSFSAAYMRFRAKSDDESKQAIVKIVDIATEEYSRQI